MKKIAIISVQQCRELYGRQFASGEWFSPTLDKDGNIFISEQEVERMDPVQFPWKNTLVLKDHSEVLKNFTKDQWLEFDKIETEKRLAELKKK